MSVFVPTVTYGLMTLVNFLLGAACRDSDSITRYLASQIFLHKLDISLNYPRTLVLCVTAKLASWVKF